MARRKRSDDSPRRSIHLGVQLTADERKELETAAEQQGATISAYARELLFRRSAAVVAATRRNPEAAALMRELRASGIELSASGNNLNQIARHLNTTGDLREWSELREALEANRKAADLLKRAAERVLDL